MLTARISLKNCVFYFCQDLNIYVGGLEDTWGYSTTEGPRSVNVSLASLVSAEVSLVPRGAPESEAFVAVQ